MTADDQLPLFHPNRPAVRTRIARRSDEDTSHEAADAITASGARDSQQAAVLAVVCRHPGLTSREMALHGIDRYIAGRRLPELEAGGYVRRADKRVCSVTGRRAMTWQPTARGWSANR